jgi:hypothetical protein
MFLYHKIKKKKKLSQIHLQTEVQYKYELTYEDFSLAKLGVFALTSYSWGRSLSRQFCCDIGFVVSFEGLAYRKEELGTYYNLDSRNDVFFRDWKVCYISIHSKVFCICLSFSAMLNNVTIMCGVHFTLLSCRSRGAAVIAVAPKSDDPCIACSNPAVGRGNRSIWWESVNRGSMSQ